MGRFVDLDKDDFIGKAALVAEQASGGPPRALVGLDIDWRAIVGAHLDEGVPPNVSPRVEWVAKPVAADGRTVGRATSVTWGPTVGKLIGFGHVEREYAETGATVTVEWELPGASRAFEAPATVSKLPFLELRRS